MRRAGCDGVDHLLVIDDGDISDPGAAADIAALMDGGEIADLFDDEEWEQIVDVVRPAAKAAGRGESRPACKEHFHANVAELLHVALVLSPVGPQLRSLLRRNQALLARSCCVDWYDSWPRTALRAVAERHFQMPDHALGAASLTNSVVGGAVDVHLNAGAAALAYADEEGHALRVHVTPLAYLQLLSVFSKMLGERRLEIAAERKKFSLGVAALRQSGLDCERMRKEILRLQPVLASAKEEMEKLLKEIAEDEARAQAARAVVAAEEERIKKLAAEAAALKAKCEKELEGCLPDYEAAVKAVKTLDKDDIFEVRSYKTPPKLVQTVMEAVCVLLGEPPEWAGRDKDGHVVGAQKLLANVFGGDDALIERLMNYDKDNVSKKKMKEVSKYIKMPEFTPDTVKTASKACASFCMWVRAIHAYAIVFETVRPLQEKLRAAEAELAKLEAALAKKRAELDACNKRVSPPPPRTPPPSPASTRRASLVSTAPRRRAARRSRRPNSSRRSRRCARRRLTSARSSSAPPPTSSLRFHSRCPRAQRAAPPAARSRPSACTSSAGCALSSRARVTTSLNSSSRSPATRR